MPEQNYKNHTQVTRLFIFGGILPLLANIFWSGYRLTEGVNSTSVVRLLLAVVFLLTAFSLRTQVLSVQDRLIRLEMRLRMREVLPADLAASASALPVKQLVALRFACDAELPALVRQVLDGKLTTQKDIKIAVKNWQGDFLRA